MSGPIPAIYGLVRWRIVDLRQWIFEEFRAVVSEQTLSRVLRKMGYRKLSARPGHHAEAEGAIEDFICPKDGKAGGGRSPAKLVSGSPIPCCQGKEQGISRIRAGFEEMRA